MFLLLNNKQESKYITLYNSQRTNSMTFVTSWHFTATVQCITDRGWICFDLRPNPRQHWVCNPWVTALPLWYKKKLFKLNLVSKKVLMWRIWILANIRSFGCYLSCCGLWSGWGLFVQIHSRAPLCKICFWIILLWNWKPILPKCERYCNTIYLKKILT